jgi:catechol 2,3-dioxygenase-like lactoylglutathione lyase family enzyme
MPISLHHAQVFYTPGGEQKARDFYGKALGLAEVARPETLSDRDGLWFEAGAGQIHLSAQDDLALHGRRHFALKVDDLDALRDTLARGGARFEEATPIPGWRRCYVFDPFGNKIELDEIPARR